MTDHSWLQLTVREHAIVLDALMSTTGDVTRELWARCPLLGTGEAVVSSPQFKRPIIMQMRPAASRRKFIK